MTDKIYCPKFVAATTPILSDYGSVDAAENAMICLKDDCGYFSKKHQCCAIVALADKPPLTVSLDIPTECGDVEGRDNK